MKKLFISIAILMMVAMSVMSCKPHGSNLGPFLEITVTGKYHNENKDGAPLTERGQELKVLVNLASETFFNKKTKSRGNDDNRQIKGFAVKGPLDGNAQVRIKLYDKKYRDLGFLSDIAQLTVNSASALDINLSKLAEKWKNIDVFDVFKDNVEININALTTIQAERLHTLMNKGEKFNDAYEQSKEEILTELGMKEFISEFHEFHRLDMSKKVKSRGDEYDVESRDGDIANSLLVVASSMLAGEDGTSDLHSDYCPGSLLSNITRDISDNGKIDIKPIKDKITANKTYAKSKIETVKTYFTDYFTQNMQGKEFVGIDDKVKEWLDK